MKKVCPKDCGDGYAGRQHLFGYESNTHLPDEVRSLFRNMRDKPMRCGYCGCVYGGGPAKEVYGHYENRVKDGGWEPREGWPVPSL